MTKQSSIELFAIALYEKGFLKGNGDDINDLLEEHKAIHKSEIVKSSAQGYLMGVQEGFPLETAHDYAHKWYANQFEGDKK